MQDIPSLLETFKHSWSHAKDFWGQELDNGPFYSWDSLNEGRHLWLILILETEEQIKREAGQRYVVLECQAEEAKSCLDVNDVLSK